MRLADCIEASLEGLADYCLAGLDHSNATDAYAEILLHYLRGEIEPLRAAVTRAEGIVRPLGELRLKIRERKLEESDIGEVLEIAKAKENPWAGEAYFVAGLACDALELQEKAQDYFGRAAALLDEVGAHKKALKSRFNSLVSITHLEPERKLVVDYQRLYRRARILRDDYLAALMLINISREYQKMGAHRSALKLVNRALVHLQRNSLGSLTSYLALVHRADLLMDLDRQSDAFMDIEAASVSEFPEVKAAIEVLSRKRLESLGEDLEKNLPPYWKERLQERRERQSRTPPLGELEDKLLSLIGSRPRTKFELIDALYGTGVDMQFLEARLKSMVYRIRRKLPHAIVFSEGRYHLADESVLDRMGAEKWA